jgi:predicted metal-binding membrane protein
MNKPQKIIIVSLLFTAALSWYFSTMQPDMMNIMIGYNPILISLFIASWTAGMAAMMFPAIIPMVVLYNKLITNKQSELFAVTIHTRFLHTFNIVLFVGIYLIIWALTGLGLLLGWSVAMNFLMNNHSNNDVAIIFGSILIISGIYQFTPIKNKCIAYCESPLSFFMKRWKSGTQGAISMGAYHGLYCLGCCWPYFLIMVALGWMNLVLMSLFAAIIFGEKMWKKGIWVARCFGIALIILGVSSILGLIIPYDSMMFMHAESNITDNLGISHSEKNHGFNESKSEMGKKADMPRGMNM